MSEIVIGKYHFYPYVDPDGKSLFTTDDIGVSAKFATNDREEALLAEVIRLRRELSEKQKEYDELYHQYIKLEDLYELHEYDE